MEYQDDLLFESAGTQPTVSKISEVESMLVKKKLHTIDFEKQSTSIDQLCKKIGLERLVSHPYLLALWSRAKYALGEYYESLRLSRIVSSIVDESSQCELLCDEWIVQAQSYLALSDLTQAESALKKATHLCGSDPRQLHLVEFLNLRILAARGDFDGALVKATRMHAESKNFVHDIHLRAIIFALASLSSQGNTLSFECLGDIECSEPDQLNLPYAVRQAYCFARMTLAHELILRGSVERARDLLPSSEELPKRFLPLYKVIVIEIELLSGNFEKALIDSEVTTLGSAHGLSRTELFVYSWTRLLALLGHSTPELFSMQAMRLKNAIEGTQSSLVRTRTFLFAALACCLTHDYEQAHLLMQSVQNEGSFENDPNNRLMSFLVRAIMAYRRDEFDEFFQTWMSQSSCSLVTKENHLYAFVCLHAHPLLAELILKAQMVDGSLHKILDHAQEEILFERAHLGILDEKDWLKIQRLFGDLKSEQTGQYNKKVMFSVSMLGSLSISYRGQKIPLSGWHRGKTRELFCAIALQAGHELSRDEVIERLWPNRDFLQARNSYYVAWSSMKHYLMGIDENFKMLVPPYSSGSHGYIDTTMCSVDVLDFESEIMQARKAQSRGEDTVALHHYGQAVSLYRGDLLPGDLHVDWLTQPREYYHCLYIEGMIAAAEICLSSQQPQRAIEFIESALHKDRSREKLYEIAMRSYAQASRREDALNAYLACKKYLNEEFGLDPSASLQKFYVSLISE